MENVLVEVVKEDGTLAAEGEMGELLITDLHNFGMPFIRYKIGDMAIASKRQCLCGRGLKMLEDVIGRSLDMIKTPDGKFVPGEFFPHLMKEFIGVQQFQVIQEKLDSLVIKIVKNDSFKESDFTFMKEQIHKVVGPKVNIEFQFVSEILLTPTGKHRVTISNLN